MYEEINKDFNKPSKQVPEVLDIGGVLLAFMEEKKMDGAELARISGVSESEVYNVLKNRRSRSGLKTLQKLTAPLGKNLADVFNKLQVSDDHSLKKLEKDPSFVMEYKKQGITIFSDTPPMPELFFGRISLIPQSKGLASGGLKRHCLILLRVNRGNLEVEYGGKIHTVGTYQKLILDGHSKHSIKNKSAHDPAEASLITVPSFLAVAAA